MTPEEQKNKDIVDARVNSLLKPETSPDPTRFSQDAFFKTGIPESWIITEKQNVRMKAYNNSAQTLTNGVITKIKLDVLSYGNNFDTTNYTYTAPVSGFYMIVGNASVQLSASSIIVFSLIIKNGSELVRGTRIDSLATTFGIIYSHVSTIEYLSAGDVIYLGMYQSNGADRLIESGSGNNYLCIHLLST